MNSNVFKNTTLLVISIILLFLSVSCSSANNNGGSSTPTYTVGGTVTSLNGTLVLQNNGGDDLTLNANGSFAFSTTQANGTTYSVTVSSQPVGQTCSVTNGSGTINASDVTNVQVTCTDNTYTVGGTLSGLLSGTLVLQNNGGDDLTLNANGSFTFSTAQAHQTAYNVTVSSLPSDQICKVTNGSGTINAADVTNVQVVCVADNEAPTAAIVFPPAISMTDGDTVRVIGTASDNYAIAAVRVNGLDVQTSDNYANWEITLSLTMGWNAITVETEDSASNSDSNAAEAVIKREIYFYDNKSIALDSANNRALVLDNSRKVVFAVDLTTGARTILSNNSFPDSSNLIESAVDIAFDSLNNRTLVTDSIIGALLAVHPESGQRVIPSK
jgi:hypothetical protein